MKRALTTLLLLLVPSLAIAAPCPTNRPAPAPGAEWPKRDASTLNADAVKALEDYAFTLTGTDAERKGIRTNGVVIIHQGQLVYERYARGWDETKRHLTWSVSKSFTNALVGIAAGKGKLSLTDSICEHLPWVRDLGEERCGITVQHLLEFSSGLDWKEVYENESNQESSVLAMLYGVGQDDAARFIASHPLRDPPGESWMYSSGDSTLLMAVVQAALEPEDGVRFPWKLLFDRIGVTSAVWERDGKGTMIGSSYLYATPRDMARFGYLALADGCWNGERILPEEWMAQSTAISAPITKKTYLRDPVDVQGRQWWLNKQHPEEEARPFPDVPEDAFMARGHWGQSITVIPSRDLIIVRTGDDRERVFDLNVFLPLAMKVVEP